MTEAAREGAGKLRGTECVTLDNAYAIDLKPLFDYIRVKGKPDVIILQLPDGLKQYALQVADCIKESTHVDVFIHGDHVYGACDLHTSKFEYALGSVNWLLAHVGHTPYPEDLFDNPEVRRGGRGSVVFLGAYSTAPVKTDYILEAVKVLKNYNARSIAVVGTAQHIRILTQVAEAVRKMGFKAFVPKGYPPYFNDGQVIGCDYRVARSKPADAYIIVSGGMFHALGLYLATLKPVVKIDPYASIVSDVTGLGERILRKRLFLVSKAMDGRHMGIIVGLKSGQVRMWLLRALIAKARERGVKHTVFLMEESNEDNIRNVDSESIDFYVVTSCPRLPIDDLGSFWKPVLTPGEAFMALDRRLQPYRFPW
ncbi:MAG: diphthamide biosynthesis enzyme Dph2 [Desulfurococcales archaeon]|nr:diphthamide biosynthesis enzyme Dph2 [Desulfurococcales archaeon]